MNERRRRGTDAMAGVGLVLSAGPSGLKRLIKDRLAHALTGMAIEYRPCGPRLFINRA